MLKTIAIFSSAGSAVFCLYFTAVYVIWGNPFLDNPKSVDFFIYLLAVAGGVSYYRYKVAGKEMGFLGGFGVGMGTTLCMVIVSILFVYLFTSSLVPNTLQAHIKQRIGYFETNKKAMVQHLNEQITKAKENPEKITGEKIYNAQILVFQRLTAWDMAVYEAGKLLVGFIISLVTAALLRK